MKILNGIVVLGRACENVKHYRELQEKAECEIFRKRVLMMKSKSAPNSPRMSLIDFSGELFKMIFWKGLYTYKSLECIEGYFLAVQASISKLLLVNLC